MHTSVANRRGTKAQEFQLLGLFRLRRVASVNFAYLISSMAAHVSGDR